MIIKVIARTIGLHKLLLFKFYTYLQAYAKVRFANCPFYNFFAENLLKQGCS